MAKYKLEDIVDVISEREDNPSNCKYDKFIGLEHYTSGEIEIKNYGNTDILKSAMKVFHAGDILVARRNVYLKRASIVNFDGITSGDSIVLRAKDELMKKILPFVLNTDNFWEYAEKFSDGTMSKRLSPKILLQYEFCLPGIKEHEKFAELLWAANDTKEAYKKLLTLTDDLVKAQFIKMFGDPVTNTHNLNIVPFKDFMTNIRYGTSQPPHFDANGQYCFIRATNIKQGRIVEKDMKFITNEEASKIQKCRLDGGEIIIVRSGANTGDTCVVTDDYVGHYAGYDLIISLDTSKSNPFFFNELLNTHYMQMVVKPLTQRSAQPHLNAEQVQNLPMIEVDLNMQNQFVEFVKQIDKSKIELQQAICNLEYTMKSLMQQYIC